MGLTNVWKKLPSTTLKKKESTSDLEVSYRSLEPETTSALTRPDPPGHCHRQDRWTLSLFQWTVLQGLELPRRAVGWTKKQKLLVTQNWPCKPLQCLLQPGGRYTAPEDIHIYPSCQGLQRVACTLCCLMDFNFVKTNKKIHKIYTVI